MKTLWLVSIILLLTSCQTAFRGAWQNSKFNRELGFYKFSDSKQFQPIWPVNRARLTQKFAPPKNPKHDGIDLAARKNTPILAVDSGIVVYSGKRFSGYGKMIIVQHNNTWSTLYAHLNKYSVQSGQKVTRGQVIGYMGRTGRASGVHLHFELLKDKLPIDPIGMLRKPSQLALHKHNH